MKATIACLFIAMAWNIAATETGDVLNRIFQRDEPRAIYLANSAAGHWATLSRFDTRNPQTPAGYDPHTTVFVTSWQPVVNHTARGQWQITFKLPDQK